MNTLDEFLAGERHDDVVLFISDAYLDDDSRLRNVGTETDGGVRVVVDGETGRSAFQAGTGMDAMAFAKEAMANEGEIARTLDGGECPFAGEEEEQEDADAEADADTDTDVEADTNTEAADHQVRFVFAFSEAQNEEIGGLYAEGDVIHAYAHCACGESYSRKWVVGSRGD